MKITRSTKCSIKFATNKKQKELQNILKEYGKVVNIFIDYFLMRGTNANGNKLPKSIIDIPKDTWLSYRLRSVAAREALGMINSVNSVHKWNIEQIKNSILQIEIKIKEIKNRENSKQNRRKINNLYQKLKSKNDKLSSIKIAKPRHKGERMLAYCTIAELQTPKKENKEFDAWLHIRSIRTQKYIINIPIKFHKHFRELQSKGQRLNFYIITKDYIQFCFEWETGTKKEIKSIIGIDTGINALASTSDNEQFGTNIKEMIGRVKRCKYGSKGKQRALNSLKQGISKVAKGLVKKYDLIIVEKLNDLNNNSKLKGRLSKNIRSSIGSWNYSFWLNKVEMACEENRVSFRTVQPYYTSQRCSKCSHTDSKNRIGEIFKCQKCGYSGNADINAALNIKERFLAGRYGSCCELLNIKQF